MQQSVALMRIVILLFFAYGAKMLDSDFPCADEFWTYNAQSGKCYTMPLDERRYTPEEATKVCKDILRTYPEVNVTVAEIRTRQDVLALKEFLMGNSLKEHVLLNAKRGDTSEPFRWQSDQQPVDLDFMEWSEGSGDGNCLVTFYTSEYVGIGWTTMISVEKELCSTRVAVVCEHFVQACNDPPLGFDAKTMHFQPTNPYVGSTTQVHCKPGFFPLANDTATQDILPDLALNLSLGEFTCGGKRDLTGDPSKYHASFVIQEQISKTCVALICTLNTTALCHAEVDTIVPPNKVNFTYGETVNVTCSTGFAYKLNLSSKVAMMQCLTVPELPTQTVWHPGPCQVCSAIRCNATQMHEMTPRNAVLASARSRLSEEEFGPLQVNQFNQYSNVITYQCLDSLFFDDRTFEKYVQCTLKDGYDVVGEWRGYGGTSLPLPKSCIPVTCMYEYALAKPTYNMKAEFKISYVNGSVDTRTKLDPILYPYLTSIEYDCKEGYETVTARPSQSIVCGPMGSWRPQLTGCLKILDEVNTSSSGRYLPPTVEAPSASQLGSVVIGIICIFLLALLFLDVATLRRDSAWFLNNVRLQKRLWQAKRRLRKEKREVWARKSM